MTIPVVSVSVVPPTATVQVGGGTQQFQATVNGAANPGVTWSARFGSITASGLYTAPATMPSSSADTVTATSVADPTKQGSASIALPAVSVSINPPAATVQAGGGTQQFQATVAGTANQGLIWTATAGSITSTGFYTTPATMTTPANVTIRAASTADTSKSAAASVAIPAISVSISPPGPISLRAGQSRSFTAQVTNTPNHAVEWSIDEDGEVGTINNGTYIAPDIDTTITIHVRAASQADLSQSSSVRITVLPNVKDTDKNAALPEIVPLGARTRSPDAQNLAANPEQAANGKAFINPEERPAPSDEDLANEDPTS